MSILAELQKKLLAEMGKRLGQHGFNPRPVGQSFRIPKPFGRASIHLVFVKHPPIDFDVVVNVAIRFDAVQEMIQKDDPLITEADRKAAATIGCELGNLKGIGQQRWTIASDSDIEPVASEILLECESLLFPFIEKYSDYEKVLSTLLADEKSAGRISPIEEKRKDTVAALSKLLGR